MDNPKARLYEALILLHQEAVADDFSGCVDLVRQIFERAEAQVVVLRKWDERKLAYEINGQKRGTFLLAYFHASGVQIANIERDCTLSEQILRILIIKGEHIGEAELELAGRDADLSLEGKLRGSRDEDVARGAEATEDRVPQGPRAEAPPPAEAAAPQPVSK